MLKQTAAFLNNYAALEKTLRFLQGVTLIGAALVTSKEDVAPYLQARSHVAIARRFFRLHKWIDCGYAASSAVANQDLDKLLRFLTFLKQSFLAMYLFMEALTITNAVGLTSFAWGDGVFYEAQKLWFDAIAASAFQQLYALYVLDKAARAVAAASDTSRKGGETDTKALTKVNRANSRKVRKQLVVDCLDLLIPGSFLGWISVDPLLVGIAMSLSSMLSMGDLWAQINGSQR